MQSARVTVTLPRDIVARIDGLAANRSRFVLEAVQRELDRRRREELRRSLAAPHDESAELAQAGFDPWVEGLPPDEPSALVDPEAGTAVRWAPGTGWTT